MTDTKTDQLFYIGIGQALVRACASFVDQDRLQGGLAVLTQAVGGNIRLRRPAGRAREINRAVVDGTGQFACRHDAVQQPWVLRMGEYTATLKRFQPAGVLRHRR